MCVKYDDEARTRSSLLRSVTVRRLAERRERERREVVREILRPCEAYNCSSVLHLE